MRRNPAQIPEPGFNLFSREQDIEIGQAAADKVAIQYQIVSDPRLQDYVASIGKRLASRRLADGYPYSFKLINAKKVNAFALPGWPVFVFSGLVDFADNEAQIAGVLSHEISHVALRHGTNQSQIILGDQIDSMHYRDCGAESLCDRHDLGHQRKACPGEVEREEDCSQMPHRSAAAYSFTR